MSEFFSSNKMLYKVTKKERKEELIEKNSPPQQKPAAPTEEAPLLFKVSIIGFASSNPLSYRNNNWASDTISENWNLHSNM